MQIKDAYETLQYDEKCYKFHNVHVKELQRFQPAITCSELTIGTLEQCKSF